MTSKVDLVAIISLMICIANIVTHALLGYPISAVSIIILVTAFISVYQLKKRLIMVLWVLITVMSFVMIDILTYSPDGTSAMFYRFMVSVALEQVIAILLGFACLNSRRKIYKSKTMEITKKITNIRSTQTIYDFFAVPTNIAMVCMAWTYTSSESNMFGSVYSSSELICFVIVVAVQLVSYIDVVLLTRELSKLIKKEDSKDEISEGTVNNKGKR